MKEAMLEELGYKAKGKYSSFKHKLKKAYLSRKNNLNDDFDVDALDEDEYVLQVASGKIKVCAVKNGQDDFIPWKRGVSL
jgi:hypothetical protein